MGLCLSVCLYVCVCVRPSQVGVLLKRLNIGSYKQHHTIAQGLWFSDAKDLREIRPEYPLRGRQMQVGWVKIGDFRQITAAISRKRYKIDACFLLKSNRKSYALYRLVAWSDLDCPLTAPNHSIFCILHRHSYLRNG